MHRTEPEPGRRASGGNASSSPQRCCDIGMCGQILPQGVRSMSQTFSYALHVVHLAICGPLAVVSGKATYPDKPKKKAKRPRHAKPAPMGTYVYKMAPVKARKRKA